MLAAAIQAGAQTILTFNIQHFPTTCLDEHGIEALHPDRFVLRLIGIDPGTVRGVLNDQEAALRRPEPLELIARLERQGLPGTAAALRLHRSL